MPEKSGLSTMALEVLKKTGRGAVDAAKKYGPAALGMAGGPWGKALGGLALALGLYPIAERGVGAGLDAVFGESVSPEEAAQLREIENRDVVAQAMRLRAEQNRLAGQLSAPIQSELRGLDMENQLAQASADWNMQAAQGMGNLVGQVGGAVAATPSVPVSLFGLAGL